MNKPSKLKDPETGITYYHDTVLGMLFNMDDRRDVLSTHNDTNLPVIMRLVRTYEEVIY